MHSQAKVGRSGLASKVLSQLTVRGKFMTLLTGSALVLIVVVGVGYQSLSSLTSADHQVVDNGAKPALKASVAAANVARIQRLSLQLAMAYRPQQISVAQSQRKSAEATFTRQLAALNRVVSTDHQRALTAEAARDHKRAATYYDTYIKPLAESTSLTFAQTHQMTDYALGTYTDLMTKLQSDFTNLQQSFSDQFENNSQAARATAERAKLELIVTSAIGLVLLVGLGLTMSAAMVGQVNSLRSAVERLGKGDLATQIDEIEGRDEIAAMTRVLSAALKELRTAMQEVAATSDSLAGEATDLSATSVQVAASAADTSAESDRVSSTSREVSEHVQSVASATEEMNSAIGEISNSSSRALEVARAAAEEATNASRTMERLEESSREIGEVLNAIASLADQTNLLALNATIEAARAGDAGRGFAVVASEVKDLAQETAKSADIIAERINAIRRDGASAVEVMARVTSTINEVNDFQSVIASAVEEQAATTAEMSRNVMRASTGVEQIDVAIGSVASSASLTTEGVAASGRVASQVARMSGDLKSAVGRFTI